MSGPCPQVVVFGGAGAQAAECVRYLLSTQTCDVVLVDRNLHNARSQAEALDPGGERISCIELDLSTVEQAVTVLDDADVVANFVGPYHRWGALVAQASIRAGVDYVDVCDDDAATRCILGLTDEARRSGVRLVTGLGSGPGVTNILAGLCAGTLDEVDAAEFGWFASADPRSAGPAAFEHLLWGFTATFSALVDGHDELIVPFDERFSADVTFPDPFGSFRLWAFPHPEALTFRKFLPGLTTSVNRGSPHPADVMDVLRCWHRLGYSSATGVALDGREVRATRFAVEHYLRHGLELGVVSDTPYPDASGMAIRVAGRRSGRPVGYHISASSRRSMASKTGVPAGVGVAMLLAREIDPPGVLAPECLDPGTFFERFSRRERDTGAGSGLRIIRRDVTTESVRVADLLHTYRSPVQT